MKMTGCLVSPLGLISFLSNVRRYRRSAAPKDAMPKVDESRVVERALFYKYGEGRDIPQPEGM